METGGVNCWGSNADGQLGDATAIATAPSIPPMNDLFTGVEAIAAGGEHTCALMKAGGVRCWGHNDDGELGDGSSMPRAMPPATDVLTGVKAISAGLNHSCALTEIGGVRCWGNDTYGQLGGTAMTDVLTAVKAIAAGGKHTCALTETGGVRCWGDNTAGQLGSASTVYCLNPTYSFPYPVHTSCRTTPPTSDVLTGVSAIAAGGSDTYVLMDTGLVRSLESNSTTDLLMGATVIAAGPNHACALVGAGGVRCWGPAYGSNRHGQLGDGTTTDRQNPGENDVLTGAQAIATGSNHTCALMNTGGVRCWGGNADGQLGDGTKNDRYTPPQSDVLSGVKAIAAGERHTCALTETGGVRCWGAADAIGMKPERVHVVGTCE
jgi:alpha-tubulin suppressor-like RCC1 family protein